MSDGESAAPPEPEAPTGLILDEDKGSGRNARRERTPWAGILVAALLHLLVVLAFIIDWSHPPAPPETPPSIPVRLVMAPPPPPPPPPPPAPKPTPPPQQQPLSYRESGAGEHTTAPPPAETQAPETAHPPPTPPAPEPEKTEEKPKPAEPTPPEKPAAAKEAAKPKPKPEKQVAHLEPTPKHAPKSQAPRTAPPHHLNVAPGEKAESGDPYLNHLSALIEQHRIYPRVVGQFGLPVDGTVTYGLEVDRSGRVLIIRVLQSSGAPGIDQAGEAMIRASEPFPPPPAGWPTPIPLELTLRLFPPA